MMLFFFFVLLVMTIAAIADGVSIGIIRDLMMSPCRFL